MNASRVALHHVRLALIAACIGAFATSGSTAPAKRASDPSKRVSTAPPDPFANLDVDAPERNLGPDPDAEDPDSNIVVVDPPSYCNGIVFYASLDGTYGPERSGTPGQGFGAAKLVSGGKFSGGVELYADGGGEAGATVYYFTPPDGGVAWYPDKVGTVSLWYRGNALKAVGGSPVNLVPMPHGSPEVAVDCTQAPPPTTSATSMRAMSTRIRCSSPARTGNTESTVPSRTYTLRAGTRRRAD